jgi:hypothetical protein
MASRKKMAKRRPAKSKTATSKRAKATRERRALAPNRAAKKKQLKKKTSSKGSPTHKSKAPARRAQRLESAFGREDAPASVESGDLEGLSRAERADSESVDELVEEGNAFEAGTVAGVEEADDHDTREVHTHEVPEDDVPDEYLDKD